MPDQLLSDLRLKRLANRLSFMKQNCEDLAKYVNEMIERTYCAAPVRKGDLRLDRSKHKSEEKPRVGERALERAIWSRCRLGSRAQFLPKVCCSIVSFQVPIKQTNNDKAGKAIDLLGISNEGGPIVIELKVAKSNETPLHMLVEALNYAVCVKKAWNEKGGLWKEWGLYVTTFKPGYDGILIQVPIIGIAPVHYWKTCFGENGPRGQVEKDAWKAFGDLVRACRDRGFPPYFMQFIEGERDQSGLPTVSDFKCVNEVDKYTR